MKKTYEELEQMVKEMYEINRRKDAMITAYQNENKTLKAQLAHLNGKLTNANRLLQDAQDCNDKLIECYDSLKDRYERAVAEAAEWKKEYEKLASLREELVTLYERYN